MPASRVCGTCGRVPSVTVLLPCGHVLCEQCQREHIEGTECPFDGSAFTEGQLVRLNFQLSDLEQLQVVCIAGGRRCTTFAGKLSQLRDHMQRCRSLDVKCAKCHNSVASQAAVDHYKNCSGEASATFSVLSAPLGRAVEEIRGMKGDLQVLRQRALGDSDGDEDLVNDANGLVEGLESLDRSLSFVEEMAERVYREGVALPSPRKKPPTPGPFRSASKHGVFITTCKFSDVYAARDSLTRSNKEHGLSGGVYTLGGYTFELQCEFLLSEVEGTEAEVNVNFTLFLDQGDWDDFLEWPFSKKVALIIAHPTDETKDIRLTSLMEGYKALKKPGSNLLNWGQSTEVQSWSDLEMKGFIVKSALYVNVEFE
ncbi:hypothetical protein HPB50_009522 [Hyalomma asiaticum]|uniref:Uncharacterized protein n=1 Tax=Hyalomma asiaticum TaxID=266040 RepID=A0ACB7RIK1_HYAAI|nr:hypothetical protein HPB50_009522 [Hyalomma asiaticum]